MKDNLIEIIDTKITDKWGVQWDEMETARDFLQNFFDANPVANIQIKAGGTTVKVFGPATFDYQELLYLGSDKSNDPTKVGQYGEGWKASVVNAMRNFGCTVELTVQNRRLEFYFEEKEIGQSVKQVVFCKVFEHPETIGTLLTVGNCSEKLIHEFLHALHYFYYPRNPFLGDAIFINEHVGMEVYKSSSPTEGYIFYKRLMRAKLDAPIVVVCNTPIQTVEGLTQHDRDRKSFNRDVQIQILKTVFSHVHKKGDIIQHLEKWWVDGHWILNLLAQMHQGQHVSRYNFNFPEHYYADIKSCHGSPELAIEIRRVLQEFEDKNYVTCPGYLHWLGMKSPVSLAQQIIKEREEKARAAAVRKLTLHERQALVVLWDFVEELSKEMSQVWTQANYLICSSDEVSDALIEAMQKNRSGCFVLKNDFFSEPFFTALSIMLQNSLRLGYGERMWEGIMQRMIDMIYQNSDAVMQTKKFYEATWEECRQKVQLDSQPVSLA